MVNYNNYIHLGYIPHMVLMLEIAIVVELVNMIVSMVAMVEKRLFAYSYYNYKAAIWVIDGL